jgi:HEPN domain-containing protein
MFKAFLMHRGDFQIISKLRTKEARALLDKGFYSGAYYLLGYAVECGLKACIAKKTRRYDFPDKTLVNESWSHELEKLLKHSGLKLEMSKNKMVELNWTTVKDWDTKSRYRHNISELEARDLYLAVTAKKDGVLSWLKKYW